MDCVLLWCLTMVVSEVGLGWLLVRLLVWLVLG